MLLKVQIMLCIGKGIVQGPARLESPAEARNRKNTPNIFLNILDIAFYKEVHLISFKKLSFSIIRQVSLTDNVKLSCLAVVCGSIWTSFTVLSPRILIRKPFLMIRAFLAQLLWFCWPCLRIFIYGFPRELEI